MDSLHFLDSFYQENGEVNEHLNDYQKIDDYHGDTECAKEYDNL